MKILLNEGWQLCSCERNSVRDVIAQIETADNEWIDTNVPGDVHSTLLKKGRIKDPFYSTHVEKCRWIEEKVWWYRKDFDFDQPVEMGGLCELKLNGLDTFATVYLNGLKLGSHENMFTPAVFDVTDQLRTGRNHLMIRFDSVMAVTAEKDYRGMWYSYSPNRVWARKAQMNFRWDWGPRIITAGIWKDVELNIYHLARIDNVFANTETLREGLAELLIELETTVFHPGVSLTVEASLTLGDQSFTQNAILPVSGRVTLKIGIDQPKLWWTHDLGEPVLYDLTVTLRDDSKILDTYHNKIGIRRLAVQQYTEQGEKRFTFLLNGIPIFAKGANWIPVHNFIGSIEDRSYRGWIDIAKEGRMNMLRVWGGGIYEKEAFYQACDCQGLLVWQDFMFACSSYPDFDKEFMDNVREEIIYTVKSLRNHPSLAIWCGNNEIQWIHGQKLADLKDLRLYGEKIYHDMMPKLLEELDPSRLYWPSSPFGGNDPNSDEEGDKHNWQVWAGQIYPHLHGERVIVDNTPSGISFKNYARDRGKFISEFGIQAAPVLQTLESCLPEEELFWGSFEMRYRNKDKRPNRGLLMMQSYTGLPGDLYQYIDYSMLAQAEGLKYGIEHYRRRKPDCSGTLIWQLNDCWPAISWSIVDFYGRPKAAFYYVKRAYHPILLSFKEEGPDIISLWASNDLLAEYQDRIEVGMMDFFGNLEYREELELTVPANKTIRVKEFSKNRINVTYSNFEFLYGKPKDKRVNSNIYFFEDFKDLNLPHCRLVVDRTMVSEERLELKVITDYFAKFVKIEIIRDLEQFMISDNYFDLMPGQEKVVKIEAKNGKLPLNIDIKVSAINQA